MYSLIVASNNFESDCFWLDFLSFKTTRNREHLQPPQKLRSTWNLRPMRKNTGSIYAADEVLEIAASGARFGDRVNINFPGIGDK